MTHQQFISTVKILYNTEVITIYNNEVYFRLIVTIKNLKLYVKKGRSCRVYIESDDMHDDYKVKTKHCKTYQQALDELQRISIDEV